MDTGPLEELALLMGNLNHLLEQKDGNGHLPTGKAILMGNLNHALGKNDGNGHWPPGTASPADGKPEHHWL